MAEGIPTLDDLLNHYQPADGEPFSSDPEALTERLTRKINSAPPPEKIDFTPKAKEPAKAKAPDLSSFGEPVSEPSTDDLSFFGEEVRPPEQKPGVLATVGNEAKAFGKGLVRGAPESAGSMMQGAAALTHTKPISPEGVSLIDELGNAGTMTAGERAKLMGRALRAIGDRGAQMDYNAALQRIARGGDAQAEAQKLRDSFGIQNQKAAAPIEQDPLYKAGKATKEWIDKTVPMTNEEKSSIGGQAGSGISGMAPYLAAGIVLGPEAGLVLGATGMGAQTAGSTFEAAKAKGASDEKAATAAGWAGGIGAALGTLPLGAVFKPVSAASDTWKAWFAAKLVQAGQSGVTFAGVGEAQEYLLQQVAKEQYDPQAGYSPDAKRVIASLLTGSVLGTLHPLSPKPSDLSSPEAVADFLRRASATGRTAEEQAAYERGAQTRSEIDDFIRQKDAQEAAAAPALPAPKGGGEEPPPGATSSPPEAPLSPTGGEPVTPSTEQTEIDGLKRHGWTDEEIASMTPAQRRREFQEAMANGKDNAPAPATSESDVGTSDQAMQGLTDLFGEEQNKPDGSRDAPIAATTRQDVLDAQPAEPTPAQAAAENYKHAHVELEHLGLTGRHSVSIETGVGGVRKSKEGAEPAWQVTMQVAYGRIKGTKGADGEPLDIFIGPVPTSPHVFIIDQHHNEGGFDEHKIMAGFPGPDAALRAYGDSYDDKGGNRIGHVAALTPEQFRDWLKGDTTQPLKKSLSEDEIGSMFDDLVEEGSVSQKGGEPEYKSNDMGSPQVPQKVSDEGRSPLSAGAAKEKETGAVSGDVIAPQHLESQPSEKFHNQIEAVLGQDYHHVAPVDIHRAAEIMAADPSIPPGTAFQYAVIEDAYVRFLTEKELEHAYGSQVKALLEPGREGAPVGGESVEQKGTTSDQESTIGADETGIIPGGGKTGETSERGSESQDRQQHDTSSENADTGRQASDSADQGAAAGKEGSEGADKSGEQGPVEQPAKSKKKPKEKPETVKSFLDRVESEIKAGRYDADIAPTTSVDEFRKEAEARDWTQAPYGKGKALWSPDRKHVMFVGAPVEGNHLNVQWGEPGAHIAPPPPPAEKQKIDDAGEKLGGARKDAWAGKGITVGDLADMDEAAKEKSISKENVFPRPDYKALVEDGVEPKAAAVIKQFYDKLPTKPLPTYEGHSGRDHRLDYVTVLNAVRAVMSKVKTVADLRDAGDKIAAEGFASQYLVQGVEPDRYGAGFKGNPYPAGGERARINADFERLLRALEATEGKHGIASRLIGAKGEPEPIEESTRVFKPQPQPEPSVEHKALDESSKPATLDQAFYEHFAKGGAFPGIIPARKFAKDAGFDDNPKAIEEAIEFAVVRHARDIVQAEAEPFPELVKLYDRQPRLGTRTSTSVRDQAYSTPVPLAYVADRLAGIDHTTTVYEPTAGNGALLITADPEKVIAVELNHGRMQNLHKQGIKAVYTDATTYTPWDKIRVDRVIANPPFGPVRENDQSRVFDLSDIQRGYETTEIDHAIALKALGAMKDDGRAVLILGGLNKQLTTEKGRSAGYNGKSKREFYLTLYGNYNVTDHFTVAGELYERQGAGWPVDVIVINGRGKSSRALPAVDVPRIYDNWESLGGLLDGQTSGGDAATTERPAGGAVGERPGLGGNRRPDRGNAGQPRASGRGGQEARPEGVRTEPVRGQPETGRAGGTGDQVQNGPVSDRPANGPDRKSVAEQPAQRVSGDDKTARLLEDHDFKLVDRAPNRLTYEHGDTADKETLAPIIRDLKLDGWKATGLREFKRGAEIIEIEPGGADTSGFNLHRMIEPDKTGPLSADEIGDIFDELVGGEEPTKSTGGARSADTRPTPEVAKSAAKNAASAADKALSGLTELFGGGKTVGMGINFDEETYKKARPMFEAAAEKFAEFKYDIRELMRRMIDHLKKAYAWTTEHLKNARPYMVRFIQDVQEGIVNLNKPAEEPRPEAPAPAAPQAKREGKAAETAGQVTYNPQSKTESLDTLVPINMKESIADSLKDLEKRVGPIDEFVGKELGYSPDKLADYFGAEQIDAIGLAIDNLNKGKGFIIGDQTGIGKGRVNAAIIKWALRKGRIPIFTTMMPDLYADIFRDMRDIGMEPPRILATNNGMTLPLDDAGSVVLKTGDSKKHNSLLARMSDPDEFKKNYDMVVTTYNQMQTIKGESTERRRFLQGIIGSSTILFDESHNAGGQAANEQRGKKSIVAGRSDFARDLVRKANGVFYSSATYAKRPDVMDLYAATDMAMAVDNPKDLGEAISRGGIPMQQAVAAMLAKGGQYIRRERSFAGINYNTKMVKVDHEAYDQISYSLAAIHQFSELVKNATKDISDELKGAGETIGRDNATGEAGATSTNFTSIMHNVVNQMLLAMKSAEAVKQAIEHIKNGEKPVLTVANTMESFLKDYAESMDLKPGDEIDADFADVLLKYLDRSRRITIKKPFTDKKEYHVLTDSELGYEGLEAYNNAKSLIAALDLAHLPISPIDYIKGELQKAGYEVGEITGRGLVIDYTGDKPVLRSRPGGETTTKGKNDTRRKFNTRPGKGGSHAIVINQSGSTGVSMHASKTFDDQSKRRMMIVQPEANIDTHMQLLGRVNRTGQTVLPEYDQLTADIPAEKRPAANLAKKMASLNANTTAARGSAVTAKDVADIMNQYGDMVAAAYLSDNPELNERLGWPIKPGEGGQLKSEGAISKLTGRLVMEPLSAQEEHWAHLEEEYAALIQQLEASGASPLEAKTFDLKARTLETSEVQGAKNDSGSPFAAPVNVEKVSILKRGKPFKPHEVMNMVGRRVGGTPSYDDKADQGELGDMLRHFDNPYQSWGKTAADIEKAERTTKVDEFNAYMRPLIEKIEDVADQTKERDKLNAIKDRWTSLHTLMPIGKRVRLNMFDNNPVAVVLDVKQSGNPKNPLALGSWKVHFAVADASRQMTLPFSRLYLEGQANSESQLDVEVVPTRETAKDTLARFQMMQSGAREERYIATGNLLAAYDWLNMKGAIINYTDALGAVRQGIITPNKFKLGEHAIAKGRVVFDLAEIRQLVDQNQTLWSKDRQINLSRADRWSDNYQIQAEKKKATGGRYYLDKELTDLTGDFFSRGGMMTATVAGKDFDAAIKRMQEIGANFTVAAAAPKAKKVEQGEFPPDDEPPSGGSGGQTLASRTEAAPNRLTTEAERLYAQIEDHLRQIVQRVAGPGVKVEFSGGLINAGRESPGYPKGLGEKGAAGTYTLGSDLIQLALTPGRVDQMITASFHESYHHIEARLQNEQERRLMEAETPRLRQWIKGKTGLSDKQVDGLAGYEVRAIAFQTYANERGSGKAQAGAGIHIMVRRWFDRLMEGLRALGHALRGLGFKTYRDIFNEAYTGQFAGREPSESVNLNPQSLAALSDLWRRSDAAVAGRLRDVMNATTALDRVTEKVQNLNEGVKRLEDAVQARMEGELPDSKAFYQKKRLFPGKVATEVQDFNKQHLDPLIDTLKARGLTFDSVGDILYAQHAEERNAYIDTINPKAGGMGSGMSNDEAQAILDRHDAADLAEIAHRIDGIRDFILDTMVNSGLESRATVNAWRAQYEHYVPLGGFEERDPNREDDTFREPGKFNVRGREVKHAFGRTSKADNPLLNILDQAYRTIERAKKNEYLRSLKLALGSLDPDDLKGFVQFDQGKPRREIDPRTGLVRWVDDSSYRFSPKAVAYKIGGNTHYMVFEKQSIAEVLRRMHPDALNGLGQALLTMQNKLKAMWTHYSPEFLIRHFLRYPIEGTLNSFEQGPGNVPRYMRDAIPFLGRASKAIFASNNGIVHPDPETAQYQRYWSEMRDAGGAMAFRQARDVNLLREHLEKKLAAISGRPLASVMDKHRAAVEAMDTVTNALDNSLRLAAYATARRQGKTPQQAAIIARDATVDFQQAGEWKNYIGLWFPFGNVAIQTGARMGTAVNRSKIMRRVFAGTVAAGFMSAMFNYLIGGDDKDGVPFFDKLPEWEKHLNLTVMNPFHTDDKGRPVPIHIPLPYNWAFPFAMGQALATFAFSKTRGQNRKMAAMAIKAGIEAFSPFAEEGNLAAELAPELLRPIVHAYTNQNWTGYPQHLDPQFQKGPRSESGFKNTGEGWKYSARMLNAMSGGDKHRSGYIDMFPEDLRELFDYYSGTGTQRKFITNAVTAASDAASGKPTNYSKMPLARVVMGTDYDASDKFRRQENSRESKRPWER